MYLKKIKFKKIYKRFVYQQGTTFPIKNVSN